MKIIIDIPQGLKIDFENENWTALTCAEMKEALMHGTPIEHEKIADIDKIRVKVENHCGLLKENHCKYCPYCNCLMGVREILELIDKYKTESEE